MSRHTGARRRILLPATAVTALGALTLAAPAAQAAETAVPCDPAALVQAITTANASTGPETLNLAPGCVYTLTSAADATWASGLPAVTGHLTINGNHATIARAQDAPRFRLITNRGDLTLREITLSGGHAPDGVGTDSYGYARSGGTGGGIDNWGPLTITDSVLSGNSSGSGAPGADATATTRAGRGGDGGFGGAISSYASYLYDAVPLTITGSWITGNTTGAGGRGGAGVGSASGGDGGTGGFGAGVELISGTILRLSGSSVTGNTTGDGAQGGNGGPEGGDGGRGGSGGTGAGVFASTQEGKMLNPVISGTKIAGNRAGRGGDTGIPGTGGYQGSAGYGGSGGGLSVFSDSLTLDGATVSDNEAGAPGAGWSPLPASGGGIDTLRAHVTLANGAVVSGNRPDNCATTADVPGCVNDGAAFRLSSGANAADRTAAALAAAQRATVSAY